MTRPVGSSRSQGCGGGEGRLLTVTVRETGWLAGREHKWSDCRYTPFSVFLPAPSTGRPRALVLVHGTPARSEKCCCVYVNTWEGGHRTGHPRGVNCALQSNEWSGF